MKIKTDHATRDESSAVQRAECDDFRTENIADADLEAVSGGWLPKFMQPPSNYDRALAKFRPK
ncbi:hypothetical protein W911_08115 [Hyphomicrobium nitrativorans NL23]|uniref:Uncharacterized protein n=1 Tax=Hyphomicrobium nitrativorans NL23 TaxID=1029756 RepID=V5SHX5_9HYPH|nr:hypothetical protein [Hyphomicrobium nitrativorans]AHB50102.1 hypothetical protein W911_08115 [Hyphomicrobium nitrativorans NL23]